MTNTNAVYVVVAYDTDYGFECEWEFATIEGAESWLSQLEGDFGNCGHIYTK